MSYDFKNLLKPAFLQSLILSGDCTAKPVSILCCTSDTYATHKDSLSQMAQKWLETQKFVPASGNFCLIPNEKGALDCVIMCFDGVRAHHAKELAILSPKLPKGFYCLKGDKIDPYAASFAFAMGFYSFDAYQNEHKEKNQKAIKAKLILPEGLNKKELEAALIADSLTQDLVNMPASDLGPKELEAAAKTIAHYHKADFEVTKGKKLEQEFPMIHAVGAAASKGRKPRLVDIKWGDEKSPKVTLVGKGVCFDTGGLDLKPSNAMLIMKKDMGGAAHVLGLAHNIMALALPVRLRVLIPAVENAVAGEAFRPGDILQSRKGLSVEIGNTDAEGRLVLADALDLADEESPDVLIDMATLTGAARVALGPDLPAFYTNDDAFAAESVKIGKEIDDPIWHMPLWKRYDTLLSSSIADVNHISSGPFAGSITAALFLKRFVEKAKIFAHIDVYAWTPVARPSRKMGAAAQSIHALLKQIKNIGSLNKGNS